MFPRSVAALLLLSGAVLLGCLGCGGGPRTATADLAAIHQPTPDPTLDAVVRDLPRALAGVPPTPTATAPVVVTTRPKAPVPTQVPSPRPTLRAASSSPTARPRP